MNLLNCEPQINQVLIFLLNHNIVFKGICIYMYIYICVHICVYIHIYTCVYVYVYTHLQIKNASLRHKPSQVLSTIISLDYQTIL